MTEHTPGPWIVSRRTLRGDTVFHIEYAFDHLPEGLASEETDKLVKATIKANHLLIAAAPELLATCEYACLERNMDIATMDALHAAISWARRGEQP